MADGFAGFVVAFVVAAAIDRSASGLGAGATVFSGVAGACVDAATVIVALPRVVSVFALVLSSVCESDDTVMVAVPAESVLKDTVPSVAVLEMPPG